MGTGFDNFLMGDALDRVLKDNYINEILDTSVISSIPSHVGRYLYKLYLLNEKEEDTI